MTFNDYKEIAAALVALYLATAQAINARRARRRSEELLAETAKQTVTLDKVHELTNSAMGAQKKALAEVTAAKYAITRDPKDKKNALSAQKDYEAHIRNQANADKVKL